MRCTLGPQRGGRAGGPHRVWQSEAGVGRQVRAAQRVAQLASWQRCCVSPRVPKCSPRCYSARTHLAICAAVCHAWRRAAAASASPRRPAHSLPSQLRRASVIMVSRHRAPAPLAGAQGAVHRERRRPARATCGGLLQRLHGAAAAGTCRAGPALMPCSRGGNAGAARGEVARTGSLCVPGLPLPEHPCPKRSAPCVFGSAATCLCLGTKS